MAYHLVGQYLEKGKITHTLISINVLTGPRFMLISVENNSKNWIYDL